MLFYADENFPLRIVEHLRTLGHDVLTALEDGRANLGIPDEDVLARATELGRAVLTQDRKDFKRLHRMDSSHAGIILCTLDPDRAGQAQRINVAVNQAGGLRGQLIRIYRPSK